MGVGDELGIEVRSDPSTLMHVLIFFKLLNDTEYVINSWQGPQRMAFSGHSTSVNGTA